MARTHLTGNCSECSTEIGIRDEMLNLAGMRAWPALYWNHFRPLSVQGTKGGRPHFVANPVGRVLQQLSRRWASQLISETKTELYTKGASRFEFPDATWICSDRHSEIVDQDGYPEYVGLSRAEWFSFSKELVGQVP